MRIAIVAACAAAWLGTGAPGLAAVRAVGAENQYADVIAQVGGAFVQVQAILTDPNTDPHSFEASPRIARTFAAAQLVVKNGLGYDAWADKLLAAVRRPDRRVIDVQALLHLPDGTPNPHVWYDPRTMPLVAQAVADALAALDPAHAAAFRDNARRFQDSLAPWTQAIAGLKARHGGTPVAVTEPVADDLLLAIGCDIRTPFSLQAAAMNATDPSPQDVAAQRALLSGRTVALLATNRQVVDPLTTSFQDAARAAGVPVVGVTETMPAGFTYQGWMLAETEAVRRAIEEHASTLSPEAGR